MKILDSKYNVYKLFMDKITKKFKLDVLAEKNKKKSKADDSSLNLSAGFMFSISIVGSVIGCMYRFWDSSHSFFSHFGDGIIGLMLGSIISIFSLLCLILFHFMGLHQFFSLSCRKANKDVLSYEKQIVSILEKPENQYELVIYLDEIKEKLLNDKEASAIKQKVVEAHEHIKAAFLQKDYRTALNWLEIIYYQLQNVLPANVSLQEVENFEQGLMAYKKQSHNLSLEEETKEMEMNGYKNYL